MKLLQLLLKDHWKVNARLVEARLPHQTKLVIGDRGLRLNCLKKAPYCYDLGAEWNAHTRKGFVFGLWCVRKAFLAEKHENCLALGQLFHLSALLARLKYSAMIEGASKRIRLPVETVGDYLNHLSFRLDEPLMEGLTLFLDRVGLDPAGLEHWSPTPETFRTGKKHGI